MSLIHELDGICPKCHKEFKYQSYESLNTAITEESYELVKKWVPVTIECPHCNTKMYYGHNILYNDMENGCFVHFLAYINDLEECVNVIKEMSSKFELVDNIKHRIVIGDYDAFVEKVDILKCKMHDVTMEFYKYLTLNEQQDEEIQNIYFNYDYEREKYRFILKYKDHLKEIPFDKEVYNQADEIMKQLYFYDRKEDYIVDQNILLMMNPENSDKPVHEYFLEKLKEKNGGK